MFAIKPSREYEAMVVLSDQDKRTWVSPVVTLRSAGRDVPGVDRPLFGSERMWDRLLRNAGSSVRGMTLGAEASIQGELASLGLNVEGIRFNAGTADRVVPVPRGSTVLVRDAEGQVLNPNLNTRLYQTRWYYDPSAPSAQKMRTTYKGTFPLYRMFTFQPGKTYSLIFAGNFAWPSTATSPHDQTEWSLVAKPIEFSIPSPSHAAFKGQLWQAPCQKSQVRHTNSQDWATLNRFAGKPFNGLSLVASIGNENDLDATLRNCGTRAVIVKKWLGNFDYDILVHDHLGESVCLTEKGEEFFRSWKTLTACVLEPGATIKATLPLNRLFEMGAPDDYTILTSLAVVGDVDAVLTATPVKIRVGMPKEPPKELR